ncbi:hypothetical protein N7495_008825 [Penicillium taxi]|uniref:uncharacterized protein n=1 Tax=Penicillium taxi TaxID=168475 RepID=UPI0025450F03|nr:uncharacterized protein N7495_008825 [Penicillium taxi]KAJ5888784.1 hypothetical protein N7495_008825 [Penicillium taxi]
MHFSLAVPVLALTTGAVANVVTETVTAYTTYCPEATSFSHGSQTYTVSSAGYLTMTNGPYTVTRPLLTETVTQCNKCSSTPVISASSTPVISVSSTPVISASVSSIPLISTRVAAASTPLVVASGSSGSGSDDSGSGGSGASSTGTSGAGATGASATPVFNAGAMNAATGAGAALSAVFGVVALLL